MNPQKIKFITDAGKNGVIIYNSITQESEYVPFSAYSDIEPQHDIKQTSEDGHYSIDENLEARAEGQLTIVSGQPLGAQASTCLLGARFYGNEGDAEGVESGTGWLINNQYVMTAGHVLYLSDLGPAKHVAVYVSPSGGAGTAKQYRLGHTYHIADEYHKNALDSSFEINVLSPYFLKGRFDDWGVIKLDSPVTADIDYLPRYPVESAADMSYTCYTQGYPAGYKLNANRTWANFYMYSEYGKVSQHTRALGLVDTNMEIYAGQSGSPVYGYNGGKANAIQGTVVGSDLQTNEGFIILYNKWLNNWVNTYCK